MNQNPTASQPNRRRFLTTLAASAAAAPWLESRSFAAETASPESPRAKNCIMIWLGGGMAQIDTFDPKRLGDGKKNIAGSEYRSIETNAAGVRVCEHLKSCAGLMDRMTIVRTVHHDVIDEHAAAVIRVHTGRPTSGTIQYPSLGSIVSHQLGAADPTTPAYVVIGYPNVARDPGFLGPQHGYLYVTDTTTGPTGLSRPDYLSKARQHRREALLDSLRNANENSSLHGYNDMLTQSLRLAGPEFMGVFDLNQESASVRDSYGGEFGQRCLLARRLVERGVRFVEVSHNLNFINGTGWDTHFEGQENQHLLIRELDQALSALVLDLERRNTLDDTLVVVGTEFGRPAHFDALGGRGHHGKAFSMVLAGGGLRHQGAFGETDALAMKIEKRPVSVPDFHATICATLGIDPAKELYAGARPVPITDGGRPIPELFA